MSGTDAPEDIRTADHLHALLLRPGVPGSPLEPLIEGTLTYMQQRADTMSKDLARRAEENTPKNPVYGDAVGNALCAIMSAVTIEAASISQEADMGSKVMLAAQDFERVNEVTCRAIYAVASLTRHTLWVTGLLEADIKYHGQTEPHFHDPVTHICKIIELFVDSIHVHSDDGADEGPLAKPLNPNTLN